MKTLRKVTIEPVYVDIIPKEKEEGKVYISLKYETSSHLCLCGCGLLTVLPLDDIHGWVLIQEKDGTVSFTPSVGNFQFPCKSHYIITKNVANFV